MLLDGKIPSSLVDLHPGALYRHSQASAISDDGSRIGGTARLLATTADHAVYWDLAANAFVDLAPADGNDGSDVLGLNNEYQVGFVTTGTTKAALWRGTAESYVNLHALLPGATWSVARGIAEDQWGVWVVGAAGFHPPLGDMHAIIWHLSSGCYANCDGSTAQSVLNVDDFTCFINSFAQASSLPHELQVEHYANCDGSTTAPVLNVDDFTCFINSFAAGCP